jgi:hypothetical protein
MNTNVKVKIDLSPEQAKKLKRGHKKGVDVSIRLAHNQLFAENGVDVELTGEQYKKVLSAYRSVKNPRGVQLTFSHGQVGGILPFLIPLLAAIGGVAARVAPLAVRAASVGARVAGTVAKAAPQIAKAAIKAAPSAGKALATGALTAGGEAAVSSIVNKIAMDKAQAAASQQNAMEGSPAVPEGTPQGGNGLKPIGKGLRPIGSGLVPLGAQRPRGKGLKTYPSKKKSLKK